MIFLINNCNNEILLEEYKNNIGEEIPFYFEGIKTNCKVISVKNNEVEFEIVDETVGKAVQELLSQGKRKSTPTISPNKGIKNKAKWNEYVEANNLDQDGIPLHKGFYPDKADDDIKAGGIRDEELLPCPFCGGEAFIEYIGPHTHIIAVAMPNKTDWSAFVQCTKCSCALAIGAESKKLAKGKAIKKWNNRVQMNKE